MHRVSINADRYTPVDSELLPTGKIAHVAGTKFDLRIGRRLESIEAGLARHHAGATGTLFDHNFVLNKEGGRRDRLSFAARVESGEKTNGRYCIAFHPKSRSVEFQSANRVAGTSRCSPTSRGCSSTRATCCRRRRARSRARTAPLTLVGPGSAWRARYSPTP